jgi:uncharacterized membrane protein YdbT with pleckstrin-like domain
MDNPEKYGYIPDPGERIIRVIHRHPVTLIPSFIVAGVMGLLGLSLFYFGGRYGSFVAYGPMIPIILGLILILMSGLTVLITLYVYHRNALIFTSIHLIQSEQIGLFNHRLSQVNFSRVQDVSGNKVGFWQSMFNFGDVEVQSAGEQEKFIFRNVAGPLEVADDALQTRDLDMHDAAIHDENASEPTISKSVQPSEEEE